MTRRRLRKIGGRRLERRPEEEVAVKRKKRQKTSSASCVSKVSITAGQKNVGYSVRRAACRLMRPALPLRDIRDTYICENCDSD